MSYLLKIQSFEGPLDLLLYLIKERELDIFEINLLDLTEQYLDFLRLMDFKDLTEASLFLDLAAWLIECKTRSLLPINQNDNIQNPLDQTGEDPIPISERLAVYETFKKAGEHLSKLYQISPEHLSLSNHEFSRLEELFENIKAPLRADSPTLLILYEQMLSLVADRRPPASVNTVKETLTVEEAINGLLAKIEELKCISINDFYDKFQSRYQLVAHILAALQMVRDHQANIYQQETFTPLWLYSKNLTESEIHPLRDE